MIEQRVNKELNKEHVELKLSSLTLLDNILIASSIITLLITLSSIFTILDSSRPVVLKYMLVIPAYKLLIALGLGIAAQKAKRKCLESHKITMLNNALLLNIFTFTLLLDSVQQFCAIIAKLSNAGSYAYYIVIIVALMSLLLLHIEIVLKTAAYMSVLCSVDYIFHMILKAYFSTEKLNLYEDILTLINSAVAATFAVVLSCYAAKLFNNFFNLYCMREAKLRHYKAIAETDALTKISNRRAFDLDLDLLATANVKTVAVAMFDIDDFKKFNDEYGHSTGDYVLEQVGKLISVFNDHKGVEAYRYGGEELTVVFSYIGLTDDIKEQIELFRNTVANVKIPNVKRNITISAGLAIGNVGSIAAGDLRKKALIKLVEEADKNLYEAKHTGKNKLCTSSVNADK